MSMKCKWNDCGFCYASHDGVHNTNAKVFDGACRGQDGCQAYKQWLSDQDMLDTIYPSDVPSTPTLGTHKPTMGKPDSGKRQEFASGSVRDTDEGKVKWSLLPPMLWPLNSVEQDLGGCIERYLISGNVAELEAYLVWAMTIDKLRLSIAERFNGGAEKYDAYNWCKGQNVRRMLDSLGRHLWECQTGRANDTSEDHMGAVLWNMCAIVWTANHRADLNDFLGWYAYAQSGTTTEESN